jgi:hypothetical protein
MFVRALLRAGLSDRQNVASQQAARIQQIVGCGNSLLALQQASAYITFIYINFS